MGAKRMLAWLWRRTARDVVEVVAFTAVLVLWWFVIIPPDMSRPATATSGAIRDEVPVWRAVLLALAWLATVAGASLAGLRREVATVVTMAVAGALWAARTRDSGDDGLYLVTLLWLILPGAFVGAEAAARATRWWAVRSRSDPPPPLLPPIPLPPPEPGCGVDPRIGDRVEPDG